MSSAAKEVLADQTPSTQPVIAAENVTGLPSITVVNWLPHEFVE